MPIIKKIKVTSSKFSREKKMKMVTSKYIEPYKSKGTTEWCTYLCKFYAKIEIFFIEIRKHDRPND